MRTGDVLYEKTSAEWYDPEWELPGAFADDERADIGDDYNGTVAEECRNEKSRVVSYDVADPVHHGHEAAGWDGVKAADTDKADGLGSVKDTREVGLSPNRNGCRHADAPDCDGEMWIPSQSTEHWRRHVSPLPAKVNLGR